MKCTNSATRSRTATTSGNGQLVLNRSGPGGRAQAPVRPGSHAPAIADQRAGALGWLSVIWHVELAAAVEPLLLPNDVGSHRLAPAGLRPPGSPRLAQLLRGAERDPNGHTAWVPTTRSWQGEAQS